MNRGPKLTKDHAISLAIQGLEFLAADEDRLATFLSLAGIGPGDIRAAAQDPQFLSGVLDHIASDEDLVVEFAQNAGIDPRYVEAARAALGGGNWERDVP
jgi:hypothetical protein